MNDPFGVEEVSKAFSKKELKAAGKAGATAGAITAVGMGALAGGGIARNAQNKKKGRPFYNSKTGKVDQLSKAFTLNRKEAKKDALNVGATGAATGGALGAVTSKEPLYRMKKGKLLPSKFPRGAGKGATALGAVGAASGVAANVGWKKKKK